MIHPLHVECPYCGQSRHTYDPERAILDIDQPCEHLCASMSWSTDYLVERQYFHSAFAAKDVEASLVDLPDWILSERLPDNPGTPYLVQEDCASYFQGVRVEMPDLIDEEVDRSRYRGDSDPPPGSQGSPRSMWIHVATLWSPDPTRLVEELDQALQV